MYNENYRIALYKLPNKYTEMLNNYFNNYNSYAENTFKFIEVNDFSEANKSLIEYPDILLIDIDEKIPEELIRYANANLIKIIKVTNSFPESIEENDILFSFGLKKYDKNEFSNQNKKIITEFDYSIEILKELAQTTNTLKLQYLSNQILTDKEVPIHYNEREVLDVLMRLNSFLELKDPYTKKHCDNVSKYAIILAEELELPNDKIEIIKIGAKLHDIGKIGIPDSILMKKTFLSKQELEIMKKHTLIGDAIIPDNEHYRLIKQMIRSHHERIDGNGYPDGLKDKEIPFFARILSIADVFDAITISRGYNKPKTLDEAIEELRRAAYPKFDSRKVLNQQLDSILVEKFIKALSKNQELIDEFIKRDLEIINLRKSKNVGKYYKYQ